MLPAIGLIVNSGLYLAGALLTALVWHFKIAALLSVATAGLTYLAYFGQVAYNGRGALILDILVYISIASGILAGLSLIVGV